MAASTPRGISYPTPGDKIKDGSSPSALADDFASLASSADAAITAGVQEAKDDATTKYGGLPARVTAVENKNTQQDERINSLEVHKWVRPSIPLDASLANYVTPGIYRATTSTIARSITGKPQHTAYNAAFKVTVEQTSAAPIVLKQTIEAKNSGFPTSTRHFRWAVDGVFLEWVNDLVEPWDRGELTSGENLDTLFTPGVYHAPVSAIAQSIVGRPSGSAWNNPFKVTLERVSDTNGIYKQVIEAKVSGESVSVSAYRWSLSGTYLEWQTPPSVRVRNDMAISVFGDSQSDGTWPALVNGLLDGTTVYDYARAGDDTNVQLITAGILPLRFQVAGGAIPASGPVALTTSQRLHLRDNRSVSGGTIAGVAGLLVHDSADNFTFTRVNPGAETPAAGWQRFTATLDTSAATCIFWFGGNDFNQGVNGQERTIADHVIGAYRKAMEWGAATGRTVLVAGVTNRMTALSGSEGFAQVQYVNRTLRQLYPDAFLDVQAYYVERAIYDAGIVPTAGDIEAMVRGEIPPSLFATGDNVHLIPEAHAAIAEFWIAPWLAAQGHALTTLSQHPLPVLTPADMAG